MAASGISDHDIAVQGNASQDGCSGHLVSAATNGYSDFPNRKAAAVTGIASIGKVIAADGEARSGNSAESMAVLANTSSYVRVLWDDVCICHSVSTEAVRRDPLVTALFGTGARARD